MAEHRIRLHGGWESIDLDSPTGQVQRIALPVQWERRQRTIRLIRRFGRPTMDERRESLFLHLDRVPGLTLLTLNGCEIPLESKPSGHFEVPLIDLKERNELVLQVTLPPIGEMSQADLARWGEIVLVIRSRLA